MGQSWSQRACDQGAVQRRRPREVASQEHAMLLQLPADLFFILWKHLTPASKMALALTSRASFDLMYDEARAELRPSDWQHLLPLLEPSVADRFFYCHFCNVLHSFSPTWRPGSSSSSSQELSKCGDKQHFAPSPDFLIAFPHAHLAMNAHFFGPGRGIPLERFNQERVVSNGGASWTQRWTAKVVDDELLLCCTHTLAQGCRTGQLFRDAMTAGSYEICHHLGVHQRAQLQLRYPRIAHPDVAHPIVVPGDQVQSAHGSCDVCLTDYETVVEWRGGKQYGVRGGWCLIVTSYHQLGSCRSSYDAKWQAFAVDRVRGRAAPRNQALHPDGAVRDRWGKA
ncbi:hypothetical protein F4778DRAFT_413948 [Xylariomycetidae sp. FL2044]|nr:hypothetical protein F4778DRAFT_413948 [Xylariomycetidae sp. FL2044]